MTDNNNISLRDFAKKAIHDYFTQLDGQTPIDLYSLVLTEVEIPLLQATLHYTQGNQTLAAQILGISRTTLRKKLKSFNLEQSIT